MSRSSLPPPKYAPPLRTFCITHPVLSWDDVGDCLQTITCLLKVLATDLLMMLVIINTVSPLCLGWHWWLYRRTDK